MSLQLEFRAEQGKFILQLPLDDSSNVLDTSCHDELKEFFGLIGPLSPTGSSIPLQTIPKISLVNSVKKIISRVDNDKSLRVKQYRISCESLNTFNCRCLSGIVLKGQEGYHHIERTEKGCILEKQLVEGTQVSFINPVKLETGIIETENMGTVCISAKKTKPTLYFRLKKLLNFLNSIKTDTIFVTGDEIGEFDQEDFDEP
ncbi:MAG: hypothetical protein LBC02_14390 [Planctomycetaceae bacterium]|jgi:hypothetical protein|nr:hypothetical protein [Planctomycetaceae bacterium]